MPDIIRDRTSFETMSTMCSCAPGADLEEDDKTRVNGMTMTNPISIVDLFSGPGGLGEGFSSVQGPSAPAYRIAVSIEKDAAAHSTLRLRAFLRRFPVLPTAYLDWMSKGGPAPDWAALHPEEWEDAKREAQCLELGTRPAADLLEERIREIEASGQRRTLLIGGPPCQAYSLAGRSRNAGIATYDAQADHRNFLYEEYVRVLNRLGPVAFVMENVKGMLSSSVEGKAIFAMVMRDLKAAGRGYRLFGLATEPNLARDPEPRDFIVRAEDHGVPQMRHRVIILGIRRDIADHLPPSAIPTLARSSCQVSVAQTIGHLPRLRSGLSRSDSPAAWTDAMLDAAGQVEAALSDKAIAHSEQIRRVLRRVVERLGETVACGRSATRKAAASAELPAELDTWLAGHAGGRITLHETRGHMPTDLARYLFAACHAEVTGNSPRAEAFPDSLAPAHRSWSSGKFNDRFRVQLAHQPSTTITSHISKDGHYFIHHDPTQCRSLTVREAARLQTFPDDYMFLGNRTEQYVQVGNAVPPWLAHQIAKAILPVYDSL
ncbi:DNA cytosine methyltransferase [Rhodobacter viridis]|nr:DNA cytosine methyltransferase [Rhodobacter viridis]